ncbi:MAG: FAD-dependent oxidoreductase [Hyphomicrobiales bacterium]|nr:FAD-dependent oxidoreductase [Hyphomicrobiales bacterium]
MDIAIIGTGISGLGAAYLLAPRHDITVYEKNAYIGGHSRTIDVPAGNSKTAVDTGFIVFNDRNYPNLTGLFKELDVPCQKSDMSFGVSIDGGRLEYGSGALFAQKRNWTRPAYYGMLADVLRFNKQASAYLERDSDLTLQECLDELNMGAWFRRYYLLAMGAAIWSCPVDAVMKFPARTFLQFFKNHGLLGIHDRPQWYTVSGGSREYVARLVKTIKDRIKLDCGARKVARCGGKITVEDARGNADAFDRVIFACHADEALKMIDDPAPYRDVMGAFGYQDNQIIVHGDTSFMPRNRKCWASWVYLSEGGEDDKRAVSLSYWMNNLQGLDREHPVIITLNPGRRPREELIFDEHAFSHPVFNREAVRAQERLQDVQGRNGLWFCGAYQRYGFHEDGLLSAVRVAKAMGADIPWHRE